METETHLAADTVNVMCSVQQLWDIPGQSRLRHVHLVHALFLGRKIVSRKKFTCAYIQDPADEEAFVPFVSKKSRVLFEGVEVQPGLLLVCSVIKNLKTGKQVLSSLVVDLWQAQQDSEAPFFNKELEFAPHGKGSMSLEMVASSADITARGDGVTAATSGTGRTDPDHSSEKQPRMTISTIGTVHPEDWDSARPRRRREEGKTPPLRAQEVQPPTQETRLERSPVARQAGLLRCNSGGFLPAEIAFAEVGQTEGLLCWRVVLPSISRTNGEWSAASLASEGVQVIGIKVCNAEHGIAYLTFTSLFIRIL